MNTVLPFVPKDDQDLPDSYGISITFMNGKKMEVEATQHKPIEQPSEFQYIPLPDGNHQRVPKQMYGLGLLEIASKEDKWFWVNLNAVQFIEFDKNFSKMVEIKIKNSKKEMGGV